MSPALRLPIPSDNEALASWVPDEATCARWAGPLFRFPFFVDELPSLLAGPGATSFALVDANASSELLGFAQLIEKGSGVLRLARIIISSRHRGVGLGRILCQLLLAKASASPGIEKFTLGVYRDNPVAISLYSSLGFVEVPPSPRPEIIAMERSNSCG